MMQFAKKIILKLLNKCHLDVIRLGPYWLIVNPHNGEPFKLASTMERFLVRQHLRYIFERYNVNCVFDVGANAGQYALALRRLGYTEHIVSFEPVHALYNKLKELSADDDKWQIFPYALGRENGKLKIHVTDNQVFSSFLKPNTNSAEYFGADVHIANDEEVEVRRLDSIFDAIVADIKNPRVFLKMDTQGFDVEVFSGAGECLKDIVGLQSEISLIPIYEGMPDMNKSVMLFKESGFEIAGLFTVTRDDTTGRVIEYDCLMVKASALK